MANVTSLPVSTILRTVWDDLVEVSVRLRSQCLIAITIVIVFEIIGSVPTISGNRLLSEAFSLTGRIAILPFEIAIFRLLILDEAASGYHPAGMRSAFLSSGTPVYQRCLACSRLSIDVRESGDFDRKRVTLAGWCDCSSAAVAQSCH